MRDCREPSSVVVEGSWAVEALLDAPQFGILEVVVEEGRHQDLADECRRRGLPIRELSRGEIAGEAGFAFHRGVFAVAERPPRREPDAEFLAGASRLLVPVDLSDPGNLGTLVRSAVAFGIDGVLVESGRGTDIYSRKCLRASATALFRVPVFEVASLPASLERLAEAGFVLLGASLGEGSRPLPEVRPARKTAVLLGSEAAGLPPEIESLCAELARIPMHGGMDSLNVAVSGGILLWEWFGREG
jgi:TrmH family RNA methyltransferase